MSFSVNDKLTIDAATASSRLDGNLQVKNSLTFNDEENVVSFNSFTVPNNIGYSNVTVVGSGAGPAYNYRLCPITVSSQGSNALLYSFSNISSLSSNISVWSGPGRSNVVNVPGSSVVNMMVRYGVEGMSNLVSYGSNIVASERWVGTVTGSGTGNGAVVTKLLGSNVFITGTYFRRQNDYFMLNGGVFTDLEAVGSNYVLGGYYRLDTGSGGVHWNKGNGSNGPWTIMTSNILPLTNFQFNPFVLGVGQSGSGEIVWGKSVVGVLNTDAGVMDSRVLGVEGEKVFYGGYVRSSVSQSVSVIRYGGVGGGFVLEQTVPGTSLNEGRLLVLGVMDGLGGGLVGIGYVLFYSGDFNFGQRFFEWTKGGNGEGVLYIRNLGSGGYRVYNSDNSYVTALGIKSVLVRFSSLLKVKWYAPVNSLHSGLIRASQRYNNGYTVVQSLNNSSEDTLVYNADKSVYSTITGVSGYSVVVANIIYDDLGNVHNMLYHRYASAGNVFSLGEGAGENFLVLSYNDSNTRLQVINPYLDEIEYPLGGRTMNVGVFFRNNSVPFKVLRVGDGIDKVVIDSTEVRVTGGIVSPKFKLHVIAEGQAAASVTGGNSWVVNGTWVFNGGTVLVNMSVSGYTAAAGVCTWTLQFSTNGGVSYSNIGTLQQYFNATGDHEHQSGTLRWLPGSITVNSFRVTFTRTTDTGDFLYLHMTELPF